jgi:DNA-binding NarL/FixJ family response regulator
MPHSVLLVDDHNILRDGIKAILDGAADFRVVGEAANGADAVRLCLRLRPDLVLMDICLPGMNGIEATAEILRSWPDAKVLILTMNDSENGVVAAFRAGVRAFLLKNSSSADLLRALRTVAKGGSYISSQVSDHLLTRIQRGDLEEKEDLGPMGSLSAREKQVLRLIAEGKNSKEIATMLDLGLQTVRTYRQTLMKKLGVTNVAGLTQMAFAAGLIGWTKPDREDRD